MIRFFFWLTLICLFCSSIIFCRAEAKHPDEEERDSDTHEWQGWTCDDMTPNLCDDDLTETKGSFKLSSKHNNLEIHYWRYTPINSSETNKLPVIVINGGPGASHDCDLPLRQLACNGREVIFYDQGGTGESAIPPNTTVIANYPFLLNATYYSEQELPALVKNLGFDKQRYHIVADSWGTMIAMQNAISKRDENLVSLSLNGPVPKASDYVDKAWLSATEGGSIGTLPTYIKERMKAIEANGDFESEEMQEIQMVVFHNFYSRNGLFADCAVKSLFNTNEEVAVGMWAPIDFLNITGTLADFDLWDDIDKMKDLPILITSGQFDMVRPEVVNAMFNALPHSERILFAGSGHASIFDVTGELLEAVNSFLERVESSQSNSKPNFAAQRSSNEITKEASPVVRNVITGLAIVIAFVLGMFLGNRRDKQRRADYSSLP